VLIYIREPFFLFFFAVTFFFRFSGSYKETVLIMKHYIFSQKGCYKNVRFLCVVWLGVYRKPQNRKKPTNSKCSINNRKNEYFMRSLYSFLSLFCNRESAICTSDKPLHFAQQIESQINCFEKYSFFY
jgi:hypothetical protein